MTRTWTVTYERKQGNPLRKTITVTANSMVEAIVDGRVALYREGGDGLAWRPVEAKCV